MPVLHIITNRFPANPNDQASPFVRDFAAAVADSGVTVEVSTPGYVNERLEPPGIRINWLPWTGSKEVIGASNLLNPLDLLALGRFWLSSGARVLGALESRRADHCLALWALPSGWFALKAKKRLGIPYSVWCLGSDIYVWAKRPLVGGLVRKVLRDADHIFADAEDLCRATAKLSGRHCSFLPSLRLLPEVEAEEAPPGSVIEGSPGAALGGSPKAESSGARLGATARRASAPGAPPAGSSDAPAAARTDANGKSPPFQFLYVGRLEKAKGVFPALNAFARARSRNPRMIFNILGWGPDEEAFRKRVSRLGLDEAVPLKGKGGPVDVARLMGSCNCLVIPSYGDSLPLVFGEALQARIPLIVTDVGDMGYLTKKHGLGSVVEAGDVDGLASAMETMAVKGPPDGYADRMESLLRRFHPSVAARDFLSTVFEDVT